MALMTNQVANDRTSAPVVIDRVRQAMRLPVAFQNLVAARARGDPRKEMPEPEQTEEGGGQRQRDRCRVPPQVVKEEAVGATVPWKERMRSFHVLDDVGDAVGIEIGVPRKPVRQLGRRQLQLLDDRLADRRDDVIAEGVQDGALHRDARLQRPARLPERLELRRRQRPDLAGRRAVGAVAVGVTHRAVHGPTGTLHDEALVLGVGERGNRRGHAGQERRGRDRRGPGGERHGAPPFTRW
jgi:hypothetical protein